MKIENKQRRERSKKEEPNKIEIMLIRVGCPEELAWDYEEGDGTIKTYVWLDEYDFVVILKKYPDGGRRLITSFWVEYGHKKRSLRKKYENRL